MAQAEIAPPPPQTLRAFTADATGMPYKLVQQTRVNGLSEVEGEALITTFSAVETGNFDFRRRCACTASSQESFEIF